jgi:CheY-like chemotaxis protein
MSIVMLIDDDDGIRCALGETLRDEGFEVVEADSAHAALDLASVSHPHIILCDVCMPGPDGLEFVTTLQADPELRTIPVVLMTASPKRVGGASAIVVGKPIDLPDLLAKIRGTLNVNLPPHSVPAER